jgi:histidine triad (HIT) family protein
LSENCLFCRIVKGEIPAEVVYEDDEFMAFKDINPAAPVHLLLVPKHHVVSLQDVTHSDSEWLGRMMALIPKLALEGGCVPGPDGGFRLVANSGAHGGQEVGHLHFHIMGGPRPWSGRAAPNA